MEEHVKKLPNTRKAIVELTAIYVRKKAFQLWYNKIYIQNLLQTPCFEYIEAMIVL